MKNKRIFISGGAGVIGTALVEKLVNYEAELYVGDLKPRPPQWSPLIKYRQGDLNYITPEEIAEFNPDYFFHLAATFERSVETYDFWGQNYQHNINLSHHLLTCLKDMTSLKKVIFTSSYLIYDPKQYLFSEPKKTPVALNETCSIHTRNLCGAAKLYTEMELEFLDSFNLGFDTVSARIFRSYGKSSRDIISRWIRAMLNDEVIQTFGEEALFDYVYAGEVAQGLIELAKSTATGIVNLGTGNAHSIGEVLGILQKHFPNMKREKIHSNLPFEASEADMSLFYTLTGWSPNKKLEHTIPEIIRHEEQRTVIKHISVLNILITSISKKVPLIKAVRDANTKLGNQGIIVGADTNPNALGRFFVDRFWDMPSIDTITVNELINYCKDNNIGIIIPTRDGDLQFFADNKEILKNNGINVMISDSEAVSICIDKLKFYNNLSKLGFPVIKTKDNINEIESNFYVVKERFGAGSRNIGLALKKEEAIKHGKLLDNPIYQPYIEGKEVSIDIYLDQLGTCKGCVTRGRDLVVNGESQVTTTFKDEDLEHLCSTIAETAGFNGHSVFQAFIDGNGKYHIIECNNRFGGASTLSIAMGLDSYYWFLLESLGEDISQYPFIRSGKEKKQIRFAGDMVMEDTCI